MSGYARSVGLPLTAGVVGYLGSKVLYGKTGINTPFGPQDLALVMGLASALGVGISELTHDMIFKHIHVSERLASPATVAVNTGINMGAQLAIGQMLNSNTIAEIDKVKLLGESVGVVVLSDYLFNNFIAPVVLGDDSHSTYHA